MAYKQEEIIDDLLGIILDGVKINDLVGAQLATNLLESFVNVSGKLSVKPAAAGHKDGKD